ncbi:ABC transporter substrate-binding protein [Streptomyces sp. NPDC090306]|uniref:ABC transporter substrate-binding protein n=1 Tax=Streptomyces sp. NPDC090306 TaxID=3365961 RepID=UPI0038029424
MRHGNRTTGLARGTTTPRHGGHRRLLALASAALLAPALLTACGGDTPAKTSGGLTVVTVGSGGNIFDMPLRLADTNGYFEKQGLKVKFVTLTAATGPSALQSGSVQFLNDSPTGFVSALSKKLPEIAISADGSGNPLGLAVSKKFAQEHGLTADSPAATVAKALAGSTGGASSANTKAEAGIFLKGQGVDPGKLKWVSLPSPAADKAALKSNQIDWFVTSEPIPLQIQSDGDGVVVVDSQKAPEWSAKEAGYGQFVVTQKTYAAQHPEIARKFVVAVQQATAYLGTHLDAENDKTVLDVAQKALPGVPADVLRSSLQQVDWPAKGAMSAADWQKTQAFIDSLGALPKGTSVSSSDWTNKYLP